MYAAIHQLCFSNSHAYRDPKSLPNAYSDQYSHLHFDAYKHTGAYIYFLAHLHTDSHKHTDFYTHLYPNPNTNFQTITYTCHAYFNPCTNLFLPSLRGAICHRQLLSLVRYGGLDKRLHLRYSAGTIQFG